VIDKKIITELRKIVGEDAVLTSKADLNAYSYDGTTTWAHLPDVVVLPTTAEQVSYILKLADDNQVPVTPRGAGTNVSGGSIPIKGGIVFCTTRMNKILDINKANLTATVEPGVVLHDLNLALAKQIADKKVEAIKSTGADIVVSSCPGCEIQLIDSLLRNRVPVKVMHIMELLA
jgi:glycolate oxidase